MKDYAIGDVHGEYNTLIKLTNKFSKDAKFIFVGDLIDRGPDSSKVIDFVRKGNHQSVLGNHEIMMIEEAQRMKIVHDAYEIDQLWMINGGASTLESYGIIQMTDDNTFFYTRDQKSIAKFIDDAEWMESLPVYIKIASKIDDYDNIVVSHASIGEVWEEVQSSNLSDDLYGIYKNHITWNRQQKGIDPIHRIFNVFGHTPQNCSPLYNGESNWINIDTGCAYDREDFQKLTVLNLETLKIQLETKV